MVEDISAGSELAGLAMQCVDAAGRPVAEGTPGKVRATWIQGTKKLKFGPDGTFALLDIRVCPHSLMQLTDNVMQWEGVLWTGTLSQSEPFITIPYTCDRFLDGRAV